MTISRATVKHICGVQMNESFFQSRDNIHISRTPDTLFPGYVYITGLRNFTNLLPNNENFMLKCWILEIKEEKIDLLHQQFHHGCLDFNI